MVKPVKDKSCVDFNFKKSPSRLITRIYIGKLGYLFSGVKNTAIIILAIANLVNLALCAESEVADNVGWGAAAAANVGNIAHLVKSPEKPKPEIMPCGTTRTVNVDEELYIESPNFSDQKHYPNSVNCEWNFEFPGRRAQLSCPNFYLTEFLCFDHLEVQDKNTVQHRYCGRNGPKELLVHDKANIKFSTSAFFGGVGFRCKLVGLDIDDGPVTHMEPASACSCGINNLGTKIVNGTVTKPGEVPWQAGLVRANGTVPFCGGSLINDRYILTAGHCVVGRTPYNLEILLNADKAEVGQEGFSPDRYTVQQILPHRQYTSRLDYDAALIKLERSVDLQKTAPVCLPREEDMGKDYSQSVATVTGWGYTMEDGELSASLRKASVRVLAQEECLTKYSSLTDRMMCAASPGTDACQGDSGGPLFHESESRKYTQIGIVSWGIGCARPNRPGVYTRVTELTKWIQRTTTDGSYCKESFPQFNESTSTT